MPYKDPLKKKANDALRAKRMREKRKNNPELYEKERQKRSEWYQKKYHGDPDYRASRNRKTAVSRYGLSVDDYAEMLKAQNYACAICKTLHYDEHRKRLYIDHDHPLGKKAVRGLLCQNCNIGLGVFKDNIDSLKAAIRYLEKDL